MPFKQKNQIANNQYADTKQWIDLIHHTYDFTDLPCLNVKYRFMMKVMNLLISPLLYLTTSPFPSSSYQACTFTKSKKALALLYNNYANY